MLIPGFLICISTVAYWLALAYVRKHWLAIPLVDFSFASPSAQPKGGGSTGCKISLIVVVRNEAENLQALFQALAKQSLPPDQFELHLVDDASTDGSREIAHAWQEKVLFQLYVHQLQLQPGGGSPKKAAITQVLPLTKGAVIAVTDGDCQPAAHWLSGILAMVGTYDPVFISGPVRYVGEQNLFEKMQSLDFAALIGVGAALVQAGKPGMCNAANMAFSKQAFLEVGGYAGNAHIPSGDDEFLLQKLAARYPSRIRFMKQPATLVSTRACGSWKQFLHQRKRWAGKWRLHQEKGAKILAPAVFLFYLLQAMLLFLPFFQPRLFPLVLLSLVVKGVADYRFLYSILSFLEKRLSLKVFLFMELVYPFYVLFFAVAATTGGFSWKERSYRYTTTAHERAGISSTR